MRAAQEQQPPLTVAEVESPIINSPFREPESHWQIGLGKPPVKAEGRRRASYFYRVPEHAGRGRRNRTQGEMFESENGSPPRASGSTTASVCLRLTMITGCRRGA